MGMPSAPERDRKGQRTYIAGADQLVGRRGHCGLRVLRVGLHVHAQHTHPRLPVRDGGADLHPDLVVRGGGVGLEEQAPQPAAELREPRPLPRLGERGEEDPLADVGLALRPRDPAVRADMGRERHPASEEVADAGHDRDLKGTGMQIRKNAAHQNTMLSTNTMTMSSSSATMVMIGIENWQITPRSKLSSSAIS